MSLHKKPPIASLYSTISTYGFSLSYCTVSCLWGCIFYYFYTHNCTKHPQQDPFHNPLSILFTQSLSNSRIPKIWKVAFVRPLFKKGLCSLPSNYRPISLTSVIGKVMEKLLVNSMMLFLQSNHVISKNQFGFMLRRSTCSQLLADWTLAVNNHAKVDAVYIDFAKAFDSISHVKLLTKIHAYGIDTNLLIIYCTHSVLYLQIACHLFVIGQKKKATYCGLSQM